jgi:hypothetical protein
MERVSSQKRCQHFSKEQPNQEKMHWPSAYRETKKPTLGLGINIMQIH